MGLEAVVKSQDNEINGIFWRISNGRGCGHGDG